MQLTTLGPRGYKTALASASVTFTTLQDRAAIIRDIRITNPSASDDWVITIQQTQKWVVPINTAGNNQLLGKVGASNFSGRSIFRFCREYLNVDPSFPLPQGQQLTIASVGGATADVLIEYEERSPMDVSPDAVNGQSATHNILPVFLVPPAYAGASGVQVKDFASQKAPSGFPKLFGDVNIPANYTLQILALWLEAGGVNTFGGSANHQSTTQQLLATYAGQQLFSRDANGGIPMVGSASAAGSANNVYQPDLVAYPAFQLINDPEQSPLPMPLVLRGGSDIHFQHSISGDGTGSADYSTFLVGMLVDASYQYISPV